MSKRQEDRNKPTGDCQEFPLIANVHEEKL